MQKLGFILGCYSKYLKLKTEWNTGIFLGKQCMNMLKIEKPKEAVKFCDKICCEEFFIMLGGK